MVQRAVDWMFPMTIEWFGLPDEMKRHSGQLDYRLKGLTNDQLRQVWMASTVPLCEQLGIRVPAHSNEETGEVELEYELPIAWDADERVWLLDETITWEEARRISLLKNRTSDYPLEVVDVEEFGIVGQIEAGLGHQPQPAEQCHINHLNRVGQQPLGHR